MLEIKVYCYDVLRYTIIGDWDKVHELQKRGYYVYVNPVSRPGSGADNQTSRVLSIENGEFPDHHEYKYGLH